ncbi:MAG: hypothetical protein ACOYBS_10750 [Flavobacterium sp.]|jgi:hypothetical protein
MRKKVNYLIVLFSFTFMSCNNYKFVFFPSSEEYNARMSRILEHVLKKDELFLCFTKNYHNKKIKVLEDDKVLFEGIATTKENGSAGTFIVNKNSELSIYFDKIKEPLKITKEQMKLYKYVYIEKHKHKVIVEFNNGHKDLGSMPYNQ